MAESRSGCASWCPGMLALLALGLGGASGGLMSMSMAEIGGVGPFHGTWWWGLVLSWFVCECGMVGWRSRPSLKLKCRSAHADPDGCAGCPRGVEVKCCRWTGGGAAKEIVLYRKRAICR
ncbi:uncharacterized protein K452DRAFT_171489 [Aplosporella prunicola CBS 121167]|uniref:Uncharacterized protein n=1 Tax=Aplosporella prunicola CBS 121167 TaxID=1176127 RepID=A0A6A6BH35_9PEZI|nr:uncharacterized protein K452DRAFT_171489 [Aplosporella prunicola CBS 121167]KAF2143462.1 hypothetical protein K452DRAFT_171489 [Aplosporella prunicola CBS 121167]